MCQHTNGKRRGSEMPTSERIGQPAARYDFAAEKALLDLRRAGEACAECWRKLRTAQDTGR